MYYTTTRSELVKLVKAGNVHTGYHTSGGYQVEVKVGQFVSLWSQEKKRKVVVDVVKTPVALSMWCGSTDGVSM